MGRGELRGHEPLVIEQFGGWWDRGDDDTAPSDHFTKAENVQYPPSAVETRDPIDKYQAGASPITNVLRTYNYVMQNGQSLLVLVEGGQIHHITVAGVNLNIMPAAIPLMTDFGFVAIAGRAYITPFTSYIDAQGKHYELGLKDEFVYVYRGDLFAPTAAPPVLPKARKAAGDGPPPTPQLTFSYVPGVNGCPVLGAGSLCMDPGRKLIGVVFEYDTGYLSPPGALTETIIPAGFGLDVGSIPIGPAGVTKRHLVSTKAVQDPFNGDLKGFQYFFIPEGTIDDNTTTTKIVHYFDADLLEDASHLLDNFTEIPSCVNLNTYHSRMVTVGEYGLSAKEPDGVTDNPNGTLGDLPPGQLDNRSVARVSAPGEPESISKIDGLLIAPLDGNALTNVQEFRDILYLFKESRTFAYSDNGEEPASWQEEVLDQGIGAPVHGIGTVLDSGGVNIDFLMIVDWSGLMAFNGVYARPEMSWKIEDFWLSIPRNHFRYIQIVNDSLSKKIWFTLPPPFQKNLILADYGQGLDAKNIRWAKWIFDVKISTITLIETKKLILGSPSSASGVEGASTELEFANSD